MPSNVSIQTVSDRTGLSSHVIRAWERRYQILEPSRTAGGHRLFTEKDTHRLNLLARVVRSGHSIGSVAHLSNQELDRLLNVDTSTSSATSEKRVRKNTASQAVRPILSAIKQLDARLLEKLLESARKELGWQSLLESVISATADAVEQLRDDGKLSQLQEQFFISTVKIHLFSRVNAISRTKQTPRIVIGTPIGQHHEVSAVIASAAAAHLGWDVAYVGASVHSDEFQKALLCFKAKALALWIEEPKTDPNLERDLISNLIHLSKILPEGVQVLAGGAAVPAYRAALAALKAAPLPSSMLGLCEFLGSLRDSTSSTNSSKRL
jgi:DNA-binding transcriptional MerR regulator